MKFTLTINCDHAAFEDDATEEICAILQRVSGQLRRTDAPSSPVLDTNGNLTGNWRFDEMPD